MMLGFPENAVERRRIKGRAGKVCKHGFRKGSSKCRKHPKKK